MFDKILGHKKTIRELFEQMYDKLEYFAEQKGALAEALENENFESLKCILDQKELSNYKINDYKESLDLLIKDV